MHQQDDITSLKQRIRELEKENDQLQFKRETKPLAGETVKVPEQIRPLFDQAQKTVGEYFSHLKLDPTHGTIEIHDERYVLVRASALSRDFLTTIQKLYADRGKKEATAIGKDFLFDIARVIGTNDAKRFHKEMHLTDPIAKLAAGPVHFAYSGWAFVDILPESKPSPDENYYLIYHHPYSFEADSWIQAGKKSDTPVCIMNAGYSSGWCEQSFGIPLTAVEVSCRAKGDKHCTFIMSPPTKIEEHLKKYSLKSNGVRKKAQTFEIPTFFERKKVEEQLALFAVIVESTDEALFSVGKDRIINTWNPGAEKLFGYKRKAIIGQHISLLIPEDRKEEAEWVFGKISKGEPVHQFETTALKKGGAILDIALTVSPVTNSKGGKLGASIIARDISRQKQAERALKDLNNSLEQLVQERTADLQRSYDELETRVAFRNLELEKTNRANQAKIQELEQQIASLKANQ